MLDAIVDYLPAPGDVDSIVGVDANGKEITRLSSDEQPFTALAFKVMTDPYVGRLTFLEFIQAQLKLALMLLIPPKK